MAVATHHLTERKQAILRNSGVPTLVLLPLHDKMIRSSASHHLHEYVMRGRSTFVELDGGHMINHEKAHQFNHAIRDLIAEYKRN
jgi:pimeloyl-ACP methyl ester carboxylesterase